jgi:hypothetical protein
MSAERTIRRYSAYFRGWATAFGEHEKAFDETRGMRWLFGEDQVGLILTPEVKRLLYPLFLGHRAEHAPPVIVLRETLQIGDLALPVGEPDRPAFEAVMRILECPGDAHLYQTYHLFYPSGTRIITLSRRPPLPLVYREIAPLSLQLA